MTNSWKFLQYGYFVVALIFLVEAIFECKEDQHRALFILGFSIFILLSPWFPSSFQSRFILCLTDLIK